MKKGRFNKPLQVDFNTNLVLTDKPNLYYQPAISVNDFIEFQQTLYDYGFYKNTFTDFFHPAISPAVQIFEDSKNNIISKDDSLAMINSLKQTDSRKQFTDYYYQKGLAQQYALNLRGGSNNIAWLISGTYGKSVDNLRAKNEQINLRFENTYTPVKNMHISAGVYYTNSKESFGNGRLQIGGQHK